MARSSGETGPLAEARWTAIYTAMRCRVGAQAFRLLVVMLRYADPVTWRGQRVLLTWPSTAEITAESGLSIGSIANAREELIAAGLIERAAGHKCAGDDPLALYSINRRVKNTREARAAARARRKRQQSQAEWIRRKRECVRLEALSEWATDS